MSGRVHRYTTRVAWSGSTAGGYEAYSREHTLSAPPAEQELRMSGDATFGGDPRLLNPEQLVVAAASACQMLEFLALASKARIDVLEYSDDAEGTMDESDEPARIQRIRLRPRIKVAEGPPEEQVQRLVGLAHRYCYVANSLRSEIAVEAVVE